MRNAFVFLLFIVAIWTGVEVMNHGMSGAFNGFFVDVGLADEAQNADDTPMARAAGRFEAAYDKAEQRVEDAVD
jgi:hypothetical protein